MQKLVQNELRSKENKFIDSMLGIAFDGLTGNKIQLAIKPLLNEHFDTILDTTLDKTIEECL